MASRDLKDCVEELQEKALLIIRDYETTYPNRQLKPICTLRSIKEQQELYAQGRTKPGRKVTQLDGIHKISNHNPTKTQPKSRAVDFGVFIEGKYVTKEEFYYPLLNLARRYNLISGIDFKNTGQNIKQRLEARKHGAFIDSPHIETKK